MLSSWKVVSHGSRHGNANSPHSHFGMSMPPMAVATGCQILSSSLKERALLRKAPSRA